MPRRPPVRLLAAVIGAFAVVGCATRAGPSADVPRVDPPLLLTPQRVLLLPVQPAARLSEAARELLGRELLFALQENAPAVEWSGPEPLRRTLARSPGAAGDPDRLPAGFSVQPSGRRAVEPLAGALRRYAALTGARLVAVPHRVDAAGRAADDSLVVELHLAVVDTRSDAVVWMGSSRGVLGAIEGAEAAALAARVAALVVRPAAGGAP